MAMFPRFRDKDSLRNCLLLTKHWVGWWGSRVNPDLQGAMRFLESLLVAYSS